MSTLLHTSTTHMIAHLDTLHLINIRAHTRSVWVVQNIHLQSGLLFRTRFVVEWSHRNSTVSGIVLDSGLFFVQRSLCITSSIFLNRESIPPLFFGGACLTAHSNCIDWIFVSNPDIIHACSHPLPFESGYFAPPLISPLCCLSLLIGSGETPAYVNPSFFII
mgnify:CR=1 FL=1